MKLKESDLYLPLKEYLEHQGYRVNSEVKNCDITAIREDELIIVELKTNFSVAFLCQIVKRKEVTDSVYAAIPVLPGKNSPPNFKRIKLLLRRLEAGLILVRFLKTKTRVEVVLHPVPYKSRRMHKRKSSIIREINGRYAEFNKAGQSTAEEKITAYKQEAIRIAHHLKETGRATPKQLREIGTGPKTQAILAGNHYGWFDRVSRGVYSLNKWGNEALLQYKEVLEAIKEQLSEG